MLLIYENKMVLVIEMQAGIKIGHTDFRISFQFKKASK